MPQRSNIENESLLLAVSGGVDSVVMAHLVTHKMRQCCFAPSIAVAHCNFSLRAEESDGDEAFVRSYAESLGLKCFVKRFDTAAFARENGMSIEMAARELRYRWFAELCDAYGFSAVCVAHNANDNAETLFLNLLRGTGLRGICGMKEVAPNPYSAGDGAKIIRPLLGMTRDEIEEYARKNGLQWRTDSSNASNDYKRNIVRNEVFPLLAKINPSFVRTLNRDMENFSMVGEAENHGLAMDMLDAGFNGATIREVLALMKSDRTRSGKTFYSKTHVLVVGKDGMDIRPISADDTAELKVERLDWRKGMDPRCPRGVTMLDAGKLGREPLLRKWQEGDWMNPIGMKGRKKVSDILTELGYNVVDKKNVMVLEGEGSHVLAVIGERVDRSVMIDENTASVYRISTK